MSRHQRRPSTTEVPVAGGETQRAGAGWDPPGPGTWTFDESHQTSPYCRFAEATFVAAYAEGFREGMQLVGAPLATIEGALVNGWFYTRIVPLGGPDRPGAGPPPKLLMSLLFRIHPELRRRLATARRVLAERTWTSVLDAWEDTGRDRHRAHLDALAAIDAGGLDDAALARHVERCARVIGELTMTHFRHAPIGSLIIGNLIIVSAGFGIEAREALATISGWSNPVRRPSELADAVVDALRDAGALDAVEGSPDGLYSRIRDAGSEPAERLDTYLREAGALLAGGETMADPTLAECPAVVQGILTHRSGAAMAPDPRHGADEMANRLADRIPAADRKAWRAAVEDARLIAALRDDDGSLLMEAIGRTRVALLEVGRRLVKRGQAGQVDDAVDLEPAEVGPALAGRGPGRDELTRRVDQRLAWAELHPPTVLGPPLSPPPLDRFPDPIAQVTNAVMAFVSRFTIDGDGPGTAATGIGIGDGEVVGTAAVVRELDDLDAVPPGAIIVARTTSPAFNTVLAMASGIVTELGGSVSHAAVMARELGLPAVVGCPSAMTIPEGATVRIDADAGTFEVLGPG